MIKFKKRILMLFLALGLASAPGVIYAAELLQVEVMGLSTNAVAAAAPASISLTPEDGLFLFPSYFRVGFPARNFTAWGIQVYTNNAPNYEWVSRDGVYGGLRGTSDPAVKIPLYWQVYASPPNVAGTWGTPQSVTMTVGSLGFYDDDLNGHTLNYWGKVKDIHDEDVAQNWMDFSIVRRRSIVTYDSLGEFPLPGRPSASPYVYLYLGMDVSQIRATQQFEAVFNIDLYNLGIPLTKGGYATPNPFTPVTGQRTSFNFFLQDIVSGFKISIYTVRGRLIRTITTEKEWDGKNDSGQIVEGGLYIYQIEAESKRVSGTVVLIK